MTARVMAPRATWIVAVEVVLALVALVVVYAWDTATYWLVWAVVTTIVAGLTLLGLNWGLQPPSAS